MYPNPTLTPVMMIWKACSQHAVLKRVAQHELSWIQHGLQTGYGLCSRLDPCPSTSMVLSCEAHCKPGGRALHAMVGGDGRAHAEFVLRVHLNVDRVRVSRQLTHRERALHPARAQSAKPVSHLLAGTSTKENPLAPPGTPHNDDTVSESTPQDTRFGSPRPAHNDDNLVDTTHGLGLVQIALWVCTRWQT